MDQAKPSSGIFWIVVQFASVLGLVAVVRRQDGFSVPPLVFTSITAFVPLLRFHVAGDHKLGYFVRLIVPTVAIFFTFLLIPLFWSLIALSPAELDYEHLFKVYYMAALAVIGAVNVTTLVRFILRYCFDIADHAWMERVFLTDDDRAVLADRRRRRF